MAKRSVIVVVALATLSSCASPAPTAPAPAESMAGASPPVPRPAASASAASGELRLPPLNAVFDYQIGGAYRPSKTVAIVSRDRSESALAKLYNICYVNAFQTQPHENAWWQKNHADLLLRRNGGYVEDPHWPGEILLDLSTSAKRSAVAQIVGGWLEGCQDRGFQAVEPDNLDSWTRSGGRLTQAHALDYARLLIASAHKLGLAVGQKNSPELGGEGKRAGFDFAIAEECAVYDECGEYTEVYGDRVIEIEYTDNPRQHYEQACAAQGKRISVILRDRAVVPAAAPGYHFEHC